MSLRAEFHLPEPRARRRSVVSALADIADALECGEGLEARLARVLDILQTLVGYECGAVLETRSGAERRLLVRPDECTAEISRLRSNLVRLVRLVSEADYDVRGPVSVPYRFHLGVPLVGLDDVHGLLFIARNDQPYDEDDLGIVSVVASQIGSYLTACELREAEARRLKRDSEEKDHFLAMVSHELRTPLHAVMGWTSILRDPELNPVHRRQAVDTIDRNAKALAQMIEDLLDVSRINHGQLRLAVSATDPRPVLTSTVEAVQPAADAKRVALVSTFADEVGSVLCDPQRLQQIVWNLLGNAIKFTPSGGRVELRLERAADRARIQVIDTGMGIGPELLPHVFDRFRQGQATSQPGEGIGLGLSIVRTLVELQGGTARAESEGAGRGSTFTVELPIANDGADSKHELEQS
jgi:signal transduction histidine kinase